jgi:hypothetical protein
MKEQRQRVAPFRKLYVYLFFGLLLVTFSGPVFPVAFRDMRILSQRFEVYYITYTSVRYVHPLLISDPK